jgi:hypothetical protein
MHLPDAVKCIAECAPGRRVRAIVRGVAYDLPLLPEPEPVQPPHPLEAVATQLLERDAQTRATVTQVVANVESVLARVDETTNVVKSALSDVAAGQNKIADGMQHIASTLSLPVKPVYDDQGKLVGAQRVKKLGA